MFHAVHRILKLAFRQRAVPGGDKPSATEVQASSFVGDLSGLLEGNTENSERIRDTNEAALSSFSDIDSSDGSRRAQLKGDQPSILMWESVRARVRAWL